MDETLVFSPSGRYGCRHYPTSSRISHRFHINDFETEKIYEVRLTSNYHSRIMYYYWPDDDHLCVFYKKQFSYIYPENDKTNEDNFLYTDATGECRMLFRIKGFEKSKELFPITKRPMKSFIDSCWPDQCEFAEHYLTINQKEYLVMFYEPLRCSDEFHLNEDEPWLDISTDPWGNEPRPGTQEEIEVGKKEAKERYDQAIKESNERRLKNEPTQVFTKVWFRFIPKDFDGEELPEVQFDMKEAIETFGMDLYNKDEDKVDGTPIFGYAVFTRGPLFYMVHHQYNMLKMNLQTFFDSFLVNGVKPKFEDFCEKIALPISNRFYENQNNIFTNNGFIYIVQSKVNPKHPWFCKDLVIAAVKKTVDCIPCMRMRILLGLRVNKLRDFRKIGDIFVQVVDIERNEHVGTFIILNKRDMFNGNDFSMHPSGHIISFRGEFQHMNARIFLGLKYRNHWLKHIQLAPLVKSTTNVFSLTDESKTPKFIKNGKRTLDMKLQKRKYK